MFAEVNVNTGVAEKLCRKNYFFALFYYVFGVQVDFLPWIPLGLLRRVKMLQCVLV